MKPDNPTTLAGWLVALLVVALLLPRPGAANPPPETEVDAATNVSAIGSAAEGATNDSVTREDVSPGPPGIPVDEGEPVIQPPESAGEPGEPETTVASPPVEPAPDLRPALESLAARMEALEQALDRQQTALLLRDAQADSRLLLVGCLVAVGLVVGILTGAWMLSRPMVQFSESLSRVLPALPAPATSGALPPAIAGTPVGTAVAQVQSRLLTALEQVERRITELEGVAHPETAAPPVGEAKGIPAATPRKKEMEFSVRALHQKHYGPNGGPTVPPPGDDTQIWLGKGQALLDVDKPEEALSCFDEAVHRRPDLAEAHVKRGMALERMQKLEEAIESYERAIEANPRLTLAYLNKGAVCNRLQRTEEALKCYEQALASEQRQMG